MTITATNAFDSQLFRSWWDAVDEASGYRCWDEGPLLDVLVDAFNEGKTPEEAVQAGLDGEAELAWDAIGSNPFS